MNPCGHPNRGRREAIPLHSFTIRSVKVHFDTPDLSKTRNLSSLNQTFQCSSLNDDLRQLKYNWDKRHIGMLYWKDSPQDSRELGVCPSNITYLSSFCLNYIPIIANYHSTMSIEIIDLRDSGWEELRSVKVHFDTPEYIPSTPNHPSKRHTAP